MLVLKARVPKTTFFKYTSRLPLNKMLFLAKTLSFYKRKDIQEELVKHAKDKEIAFRFDETFGKRPETLSYPNDVLELAKQRVTSFHCSEELWTNPLQLSTKLRRKELDALRKGWDLIFDIDCPVWELSKITTWLVIRALKEHGIRSIYVKFSGNKGFHVALPFEIFPEEVNDIEIKDKFPEFAIKIMLYLLDFISKNYIKVESETVIFRDGSKYKIGELSQLLKKDIGDLTYWYCESCKKRLGRKWDERQETIVTSKDIDFISSDDLKNMKKSSFKYSSPCNCNLPKYRKLFDPLHILNIDAMLGSSRHLYRMPYSFHEKSQLISVPIDPDHVLDFNKEDAKPENVTVKYPFLERRSKKPEAIKLWQDVFDFKSSFTVEQLEGKEIKKKFEGTQKAYSLPEKAIGEENFPPCIKIILKGLEDGRKRSTFILINFLASCGWDYGMIEKRLMEWNEQNHEPLRPQYILGQLRYAKQGKEILPPPNCGNLAYYKGFSVCKPEDLCSQIKNPLQYAKRKERSSRPVKKKK